MASCARVANPRFSRRLAIGAQVNNLPHTLKLTGESRGYHENVPDSAGIDVDPIPQGRSVKFVRSVVWNWAGVSISLITGFLLSPYLFRRLGPEGYGIWALSFSLIEYYWLLDLGVRSATAKFVAHYWTTGEPDEISKIMSTAVTYSCLIAVFMLGIVTLAAPGIESFFHISDSYHESFRALLLLITVSWCLGLIFNLFSAALEAVQRFDVSNRISIITTGSRAAVWFAVLYSGYGIVALGVATLLNQCLMYALNYYYFRKVLPNCLVSFRHAGFGTLKKMWNYGIHTFLQTVSMMGLNQGPPILIGHFLPTEFVGFFNLPMRLLQYVVEFIGRIGVVTNVNAAALAAREESRPLAKLAEYANRYCLAIFMPLGILLWIYGNQFFRLWIGPAGAAQAAPLLPILLIGYIFAVVAQFSSSMLLLGLGKHQRYAKGLFAEAVIAVAALWLVIPRWGIIGAAWTCSILMILNRGVFAPWLVCKTLSLGFSQYMGTIYIRPLVVAAPAIALAYLARATILPGVNWFQIFAAGAVLAALYYGIAYLICLDRDHRLLLRSWLRSKAEARP
jgi:O-antigen/teichoic acid export membrane protein